METITSFDEPKTKKEQLKESLFALKEYLKGKIVKKGNWYIPKPPKRNGKFTKKHYNFKKVKIKRQIQKLSRRRNRR
jgi:sialic acid synthase SpsE